MPIVRQSVNNQKGRGQSHGPSHIDKWLGCDPVASALRQGQPKSEQSRRRQGEHPEPPFSLGDNCFSGNVVAEGISSFAREYELHEFVRPERVATQLALPVGRLAPFDENERRTPEDAASELASGRLGLVRAAYLTVFPESRLIALQLPTLGSDPPTAGRGKINGMSDESRRRLMALLHTIKRRAANPAFVTLTFPDDAIPSPRGAKIALQTFFKRWKRRNASICAVWRVEAHPERSQARGEPVPHFHLLVWGAWIDRFQLSKDWADVVGAPDYMAHLAAGTKVESIRSFRGVCSYASKYISKAEVYSLGEDAGRVWGIFNKGALPVGPSLTVKLDSSETIRVVRYVKRLLFSRGVKTEWMPRSIYCEAPEAILRLLAQKGGP